MNDQEIKQVFDSIGISDPTTEEIQWYTDRMKLDPNQSDWYLSTIKQARHNQTGSKSNTNFQTSLERNKDQNQSKSKNYFHPILGARERWRTSLDNGTNPINGLINVSVPTLLLYGAVTNPVGTLGAVGGGLGLTTLGDVVTDSKSGGKYKSVAGLIQDKTGLSRLSSEFANPLTWIGGAKGYKLGTNFMNKLSSKFSRQLPKVTTKFFSSKTKPNSVISETSEQVALPENTRVVFQTPLSLPESRFTALNTVREVGPSENPIILEPRTLSPESQTYWLQRYQQDPQGTLPILQQLFQENGLRVTPQQTATALRRRDNLLHNTNGVRGQLQRIFGNMRSRTNEDGVQSFVGSFEPAQYDPKGNMIVQGSGLNYTFTPITGRRNPSQSPTFGTLRISGMHPFDVDLSRIPFSAQSSPRITPDGRIRQSFAGYPEGSNYIDWFTTRSNNARQAENRANIRRTRFMQQAIANIEQGLSPLRSTVQQGEDGIFTGQNIFGHPMIRRPGSRSWEFVSSDDRIEARSRSRIQNNLNLENIISNITREEPEIPERSILRDLGLIENQPEIRRNPLEPSVPAGEGAVEHFMRTYGNENEQPGNNSVIPSFEDILLELEPDEYRRSMMFGQNAPVEPSEEAMYRHLLSNLQDKLYDSDLSLEQRNDIENLVKQKISDEIERRGGYNLQSFGIDRLFRWLDGYVDLPPGLSKEALQQYMESGPLVKTYKQAYGLDNIPSSYIPFVDQHTGNYSIQPENIARIYLQDLRQRFESDPTSLSKEELSDLAALTYRNDPTTSGTAIGQLKMQGHIDMNATRDQVATFLNKNSNALHRLRQGLINDNGTHAAVFDLTSARNEVKRFLNTGKQAGGYYDVHDVSPHSYNMEIRGAKKNPDAVIVPKNRQGEPETFSLNRYNLFHNSDLQALGLPGQRMLEQIGDGNISDVLIPALDQAYTDGLIKMFADRYMAEGLDKYHAIVKALIENETNPESRAEYIRQQLKGIVVDGNDLSNYVTVKNNNVFVPNIQFRYKIGGKLNYLNMFKNDRSNK